MIEKESKALKHYQKIQECLTDLMDPNFSSQAQSFAYIVLNQTYTNLERLFELMEESVNLSRPRQAMLARLAHHIENTKADGVSQDFIDFLRVDVMTSLVFIRELLGQEFDLAS